MASRGINKATIVGNLGNDPEFRTLPDGTACAVLSIATSEVWKDKNTGEQKVDTEWHRAVVWGKLAEIANQYARKGSKVYVEGKLKTRKWQDQQGVDRYTTEIVVDMRGAFQLLDKFESAAPDATPSQQPTANAPMPQGAPGGSDFDDDISF